MQRRTVPPPQRAGETTANGGQNGRASGRLDGSAERASAAESLLLGRSVHSVSGSVGEADSHEAPQLGRPNKLTVLVPKHILGGEG